MSPPLPSNSDNPSQSGPRRLRQLQDQLAEIERIEQDQRDQVERALRVRWLSAEQAYVVLETAVRQATITTLNTYGFYQHARGQWRKKRGCLKGGTVTMEELSNDSDVALVAPDVTYQAELATRAETEWINLISGGNPERQVELYAEMEMLQRRYGRANDSALERALVRNLVLCELQLAFADATYAACRHVSLAQARFLLKRQKVAQQRFLGALKTLAQVRKLMSRRRIKK